MKAIRVHRYGGPEVLKYEEIPPPEPSAGVGGNRGAYSQMLNRPE